MDIRVKKTTRGIINAFLELRAYKPLEKITVKELCEKAEINKSTFYKHYEDIFDLSRRLEAETVAQVLENLPHPEYLLERPGDFMKELQLAFHAQEMMINRIFSGSRSGQLVMELNTAIRRLVFQCRPDWEESDEANVYLAFMIFGGYHALRENHARPEASDILARLVSTTQPPL